MSKIERDETISDGTPETESTSETTPAIDGADEGPETSEAEE